ncbi:hypothetical protein [Paenibacillus sp. YYML68]|uniref:YphA family membrane protein n=1 Tax=Paenibacillus sp. YYML68 TaxID=2909250 RepID=UPI002491BFFF|nr:hypothetical protein [Paenibacillus sp. YYML68]
MNAGYLSLLLVVVALILVLSGWKDILLRGMTPTSLLLFFVLWIVLLPLSFEWQSIQFSGSAILWIGILSYVFVSMRGSLLRFHLISVSLLLSSVYFFLKETIHLMPTIMIWNATFTTALMVGVLAAGLLRQPGLQIAAITAALLLGESMSLYAHRDTAIVVIGHAGAQDLWWLSIFTARAVSLLLEAMGNAVRGMAKRVADRLRIRKP